MSGPVVFALTVFGTAEPAGSKRAVSVQLRDGTARSNVIDANPRAKRWKDFVSQEAGIAMQRAPLLRGPLKARFTFYVKRPKGHYGKRGLLASAPAYPTVRPDVLKLARAVEDALTGTVYGDDAQIVWEILRKEYGEPERCEIVLEKPSAILATNNSAQIALIGGASA